MDANIGGNSGVGGIATHARSRALGRVFVYVEGAGVAEEFGSTIGGNQSRSDDSCPPNISRTGKVTVLPGSGANVGGFLAIGFAPYSGTIPGILGTLYIDPAFFLLHPLSGAIPLRGTETPILIPNQNFFLGRSVYFQGVIGKVNRTELTNGLRWTVGR